MPCSFLENFYLLTVELCISTRTAGAVHLLSKCLFHSLSQINPGVVILEYALVINLGEIQENCGDEKQECWENQQG